MMRVAARFIPYPLGTMEVMVEFDKAKYQARKLPHPLLLHWVLNPGIAFNELVLGQRIPKLMLIDKTSDAPLVERQYVPCPQCHALNDARLWSKGNAFGHWFGYVCPACDAQIPCLWNFTSLIILALTFPIWIGFRQSAEKRWLTKEKARLPDRASDEIPEAKQISWLKMGLGFGVMMFSVMTLPKVFLHQLSADLIALQTAIWLVTGVLFGLMMKWFLGCKR